MRFTADVDQRIRLLLQDRLGADSFVVRENGKQSPPNVNDIVSDMLALGVNRFVSLPLTPFGSRLSTENYHRAVRRALEAAGSSAPVITLDRWYEHKLFINGARPDERAARKCSPL